MKLIKSTDAAEAVSKWFGIPLDALVDCLAQVQDMSNARCKNCSFHDDFTWACSNGLSPHCADFTANESTCDFWDGTSKKWRDK